MFRKVLRNLVLLAIGLAVGLAFGVAHRYYVNSKELGYSRLGPTEVPHFKATISALNEIRAAEVTPEQDENNPARLLLDVQGELQRLSTVVERNQTPELEPIVDLHKGFAFFRVSAIEQGMGNTNASRDDLQRAEAEFASLGWKDYSDAALHRIADDRLRRLQATSIMWMKAASFNQIRTGSGVRYEERF